MPRRQQPMLILKEASRVFADGAQQSGGDAAQRHVPRRQQEPQHGGRAHAISPDGKEARHVAVQRRALPVATATGHLAENELGLRFASERQRGLPIDLCHTSSTR